jgi:hypothetical protein
LVKETQAVPAADPDINAWRREMADKFFGILPIPPAAPRVRLGLDIAFATIAADLAEVVDAEDLCWH